MRSILPYLKAYRGESVLSPLFKMLEALMELFVPLVMARIMDEGIALGDTALITRMGLLLVAQKEGLWPDAADIDAALAAWDEARDGARTFPANDRRKARQKLAAQRAETFILDRSTLTPPPAQPVLAET